MVWQNDMLTYADTLLKIRKLQRFIRRAMAALKQVR